MWTQECAGHSGCALLQVSGVSVGSHGLGSIVFISEEAGTVTFFPKLLCISISLFPSKQFGSIGLSFSCEVQKNESLVERM